VIDEGVPRALARELASCGCNIAMFPSAWKGLRNGSLLARMRETGFDCLVTCDKNLEWQQPIRQSEIAIVVLPFQKLGELRPIVDRIAEAISSARQGEVTRIEPASRVP
jgi:hypothetical protein